MNHLIPFRPLIVLLIVLIRFGGVHIKQFKALLPWLIKVVLFEPFRWLEALVVVVRRPFVKRKPPVFVLGFYRSGTTWLQELMACDEHFTTPTIFRTVLPEFMLLLEPVLKPLLQAISQKLKVENPYHRLSFDWDFPGEEDVAINALSCLSDYNRVYQYPSHASRWVNQHFDNLSKNKNWIKAHQYFIDKLMMKSRHRRLILKSPPHTGRIRALKEAYPTAKFIFIKRDKETCCLSNERLWKINQAYSFESYEVNQIKGVIQETYDIFHQRYEQEKHLLSSDELVELSYDELIHHPKEAIEKVYEQFDLTESPQTKKIREAKLKEREGYQPINHQLNKTT